MKFEQEIIKQLKRIATAEEKQAKLMEITHKELEKNFAKL